MTGISAPSGNPRAAAPAPYHLPEMPPPGYDRFTELGARLFQVPICYISLVGEAEQLSEFHHDVDICGASREIATCAHLLIGNVPLVVLDTTLDPRFSDYSPVSGARMRFYAGVPLIDAAGRRLGVYCILGPDQRDRFSDEECRLRTHLAAMVVKWLGTRRAEGSERAVIAGVSHALASAGARPATLSSRPMPREQSPAGLKRRKPCSGTSLRRRSVARSI